MILGCLLGLASALTLAWDEVACASVLELLLARPPLDISEFGTRLVRVSWAPIGVAAGTTLTLLGLQQAKRRVANSTASSVLVLLSAIFACSGAFAMASGIQQAQAVLKAAATVEGGMPTETFQAAVRVAVTFVSLGWRLLAIAQATLAMAAVVQAMTRSNGSSPLLTRPMEDLAAIVLVGLFGVIVSWSWFSNGLAIERIRGQEIKASELVAQLNRVLSFTVWGAWALLVSSVVRCWNALAPNR
jgi:hypothetical protein